MAAGSGDILRFTDKQTLLGEEMLNVYFYQVNDTTGLAGDYLSVLSAWLRDNVIAKVKVVQSPNLEHIEVFAENLTNGVDIVNFVDGFPIAGTGTALGNNPPFVTYNFELLREERTTRNGRKAIAGTLEGDVTDGVYTGSMTPIHDIEDILGADMVLGLAHICNPVIVRHPIHVPLTSPVLSHISAGQFNGVGSQNTRKFGRGI